MTAVAQATNVAEIPGLRKLWKETLGDPRICIAILDGPVDASHPSLSTANLTPLKTLISGVAERGSASKHGTHVASVIFGQHDGPVKGIAPYCRGLMVPIFSEKRDGRLVPCSQVDLARAIAQAVRAGAQIINISGGELAAAGVAHSLLADAVRRCAAGGVLIVAAAGNDGCDCLHVPGALPSVLAVGAMDAQGAPLDFSNWGRLYGVQGVLAPGENITGARPGGGTTINSGTSYAAPIVAGIAGLLLSLQLKRGQEPGPHAVRAAILDSALGCKDQPVQNCNRLLAGRLNIQGAITRIERKTMDDAIAMQEKEASHTREDADAEGFAVQTPAAGVEASAAGSHRPDPAKGFQPAPVVSVAPSGKKQERGAAKGSVLPGYISPSGCSCGGGEACTCGAATVAPLVYAFGALGLDFGSDARRDSIAQHMEGNPHDASKLLAYLEKNPWDAASIIWTLNLDDTPIYAVQPQGPFAGEAYQRLREFLGEQVSGGIERVSIGGLIVGNVRLLSDIEVPVIWPEIRCMYSWTTASLVEAVGGKAPAKSAKAEEKGAYDQKAQAVRNFLERVYYELRNTGRESWERAINYAATNALNVHKIFESALKEDMELDAIEVERSPICRPDSDCWDVKLTFFNPRKVFEQARKVYRFTVDVSDVCPVMIGKVRSWFAR